MAYFYLNLKSDNSEKIAGCFLSEEEAKQRRKRASLRKACNKYTLKKKYKIDEEGYNDIFAEQGGRCAICGIHQSELKKKLSIDHDHKTGKVRGLLCLKCNFLLGYAKEDIEILQTAIKYLKEHK